jgi:uncharacterized coiled-coil protein SlyX
MVTQHNLQIDNRLQSLETKHADTAKHIQDIRSEQAEQIQAHHQIVRTLQEQQLNNANQINSLTTQLDRLVSTLSRSMPSSDAPHDKHTANL